MSDIRDVIRKAIETTSVKHIVTKEQAEQLLEDIASAIEEYEGNKLVRAKTAKQGYQAEGVIIELPMITRSIRRGESVGPGDAA